MRTYLKIFVILLLFSGSVVGGYFLNDLTRQYPIKPLQNAQASIMDTIKIKLGKEKSSPTKKPNKNTAQTNQTTPANSTAGSAKTPNQPAGEVLPASMMGTNSSENGVNDWLLDRR
jgi:hypothetical protein